MLVRAKRFFVEARQELKQVRWPTRREAIYLTWIVIVISLILAAFLGAFDYLFSYVLRVFVL